MFAVIAGAASAAVALFGNRPAGSVDRRILSLVLAALTSKPGGGERIGAGVIDQHPGAWFCRSFPLLPARAAVDGKLIPKGPAWPCRRGGGGAGRRRCGDHGQRCAPGRHQQQGGLLLQPGCGSDPSLRRAGIGRPAMGRRHDSRGIPCGRLTVIDIPMPRSPGCNATGLSL